MKMISPGVINGRELTPINHMSCIMEVDTMVGIGEDMNIIIVNSGEVKIIYEHQRILHVDVVVGNAVHEEEADGVPKGLHI